MSDYVVSVSGEDLLVTRKVDREVAEMVVVEVLTKLKQSRKQEAVVEKSVEDDLGEGQVGETKVNLYGFVKRFEVERTVDKILLIGVYLARYQDTNLFEKKDLVAGLEAMAEPIPKNLSRDIGWGVKIGWLAKKVGVRGVYYVTDKGYEVADSGFAEELVGKTAMAKVKKK